MIVYSSEEEIEAPPTNKPCVSKPKLLKKRLKYCPTSSSSRKYQRRWEKDLPWLEHDADCESVFCKLCKTCGHSFERTGRVWSTKPFINWKKADEKMKTHTKSDAQIAESQAALAHQASLHTRSVIQQLQNVAEQ